jgi:alpha-amylase/alpha-mannosidase (GH57 family)
MPKIYVCFLWHMHQPFYKDLVSGAYRLPWTRLHALKDYRGMLRILEAFPRVRQTFNLVPSMMVQVEEYAAGQASDPFLACALKPAESLTDEEQAFILTYFFQANPARLIQRYPRYGELYEAWLAADRNVQRARRMFSVQAFRDLQVLSQLAWFDEEVLEGDGEIRELVLKGRGYSADEQALLGRKQADFLSTVLPAYKEFAARGQIEISTTPFYHPILPLLCDSDIAGVAHPHVPLPARFRYPQDARLQLERARGYIQERFGAAPAGLWPSEGSVSDEVLEIAADLDFRWVATDNGVLARTLGRSAGVEETYRPYVWRNAGRELRMVFRDHFLSDLVGFVYARMGAAEAASDLLGRIRDNCRGILAAGRAALVPIILDGENAWEHYEENGRPFLRELYQRISDAPEIEALTLAEALSRVEPEPLEHIFPASWINANFDIWIGAEEDNRAWEYLLAARQTYDRVISSPQGAGLSEENRNLALEELLIAEGSDWCWWYGPEHGSENRPEFDKLFRDHLANVYRALGLPPPEELSRPILKIAVPEFHAPPSGPIQPVIDGEVTSFFEWLGAGVYRVDARSGAMHGRTHFVRELHYGHDASNLYLRLDFAPGSEPLLASMQVRVGVDAKPEAAASVTLQLGEGGSVRADVPEVEACFRKVLEIRLPFAVLGTEQGHLLRFHVSLWHQGLPMDSLPAQGRLECPTAEPADWHG